MGLKPDHWIRKMATEQRMIEPFEPGQVRNGQISYGVSSYGYDIRVADEFMIFTNVYSAIVDPKHFDPRSMVEYKGDVCVIPPNSFALARTVEYFRIPKNVLTVCLGKSTYARCGIIVNVTPFEPEWEGFVTLEISNTTRALCGSPNGFGINFQTPSRWMGMKYSHRPASALFTAPQNTKTTKKSFVTPILPCISPKI